MLLKTESWFHGVLRVEYEEVDSWLNAQKLIRHHHNHHMDNSHDHTIKLYDNGILIQTVARTNSETDYA